MKKNIIALTLLLELITYVPMSAVSVVYNFRIAQITRQPIAKSTSHRHTTLSGLLFDFFQKNKHFDIRENYAGGLITFNHDFAEKYYFRTDFAVAHASQTIGKITQADDTEPDDILCTMGRNFILNKKSRVTLSGLFGIPTHSVNTLQRAGFGTGQVGVGAQLDGLYKFNNHIDVLWGTRYNYFIPRTAFDALDNSYKFTIGSIADILIALQSNNLLPHGLEGGYAARWGFGIDAKPIIPEIESKNYMRNNFFLVYKYTFLTKRVANRFLFNISYGFDSKPKNKGFKAVMIWGAYGIAF
jgi:hypothetical protein